MSKRDSSSNITRRDVPVPAEPEDTRTPSEMSRENVREFVNPWARIPVEARREMIADLRQRPFPWLKAHKILAKQFGVKTWEVASLVKAVALFGFEDPGLNGTEPKQAQEASGGGANGRRR